MECGESIGVDAFVGWEVWDFNAEEVVVVAGDVVAFGDLGNFAGAVLEALDVLALVSDEPNRDEGREAAAVRFGVDSRPVAADDPVVLESSKPSRAG